MGTRTGVKDRTLAASHANRHTTCGRDISALTEAQGILPDQLQQLLVSGEVRITEIKFDL